MQRRPFIGTIIAALTGGRLPRAVEPIDEGSGGGSVHLVHHVTPAQLELLEKEMNLLFEESDLLSAGVRESIAGAQAGVTSSKDLPLLFRDGVDRDPQPL